MERVQKNENNYWSGKLNVELNEELFLKVSAKAVMEKLNFMKTRKAAGPSGITFELLKVSSFL